MVSGKAPASDSTASPILSPTLDLPPSYDTIASSEPGSSSRPVTSFTSQPPKDTLHLFSGPLNAEPLLGRADTPLEVLNGIQSFTGPGGWISSHDPRLQNPTTLYDWIRHQALQPLKLTITCQGVHFETPERDEYVTDRDGQRYRRKGQPERIVDFEFTIDLTPTLAHTDNFANVHLSTVSGDIATNRGSHSFTYSSLYARAENQSGANYARIDESTTPGRIASKGELLKQKQWADWRNARGLPPWAKAIDWKEFIDRKGKSNNEPETQGRVALLEDDEERDVGVRSDDRDEARLKAWCEAFCADQGWCKEFYVPYLTWGWDMEGLFTAIKGAITSTGYNSNHISIEARANVTGLVVRPPNLISRMLNKTIVYVLLWITLLYPFVWLWKRFSEHGGAPYNVARTTYGMKYYPPLPSTYPGETLSTAQERLGGMYKIHRELPKPTSLVPGPKGIHYLLGRKEGEWFREWEERIRMGVRMRYRGELEGGGEEGAGGGLDGY